MNSARLLRFIVAAVCLACLASCKQKPRYAVGDHLIPMGSSDPSQIVTIIRVGPESYTVSSAPSPKPSDPGETRSRREIDSDYVRIDLPVGGSWLTEEDRAAAIAQSRKNSPTPSPSTPPAVAKVTATASATPTVSSAGIDIAAITPAVRPAMGLLSTFDSKGKILRNTTGFFVSNDGRFVTTADAVAAATNGIVNVQSGAIYNVTGLLAVSTVANIAIVKVESGAVPVLPLTEIPNLQSGTAVAIADTLLRKREDAIVAATFSRSRTEPGGDALEISGNNLRVSAGSAVLDSTGRVIGCATRDEAGPVARAIRGVATINALLAQSASLEQPTWPAAAQLTPTPTPTPRAGGDAAIVYAPSPVYPPSARFTFGLRPSGTGRYLLKFGTDGRVASVAVVQSTGSSALDAAALQALRTWRAKPGAPSQRIVPITFRP